MKVNMAKVRATVAYWQSLTAAQRHEVATQAQERAKRARWDKEAEDATS